MLKFLKEGREKLIKEQKEALACLDETDRKFVMIIADLNERLNSMD